MFGVRMLTFVASFKMRRLIKLAASRVRLRMLAAYSSDRSSAAVYVGPNWTQNIDKWIVFIGEEIRCAAWENRVLLSSGAPRRGSFLQEWRGCLAAQVRQSRPHVWRRTGSNSSLHFEACTASGASDGFSYA